MASRARAQISKRRSGLGYLVGEGCKEVCLMPFPLLWLPRRKDSAEEAGGAPGYWWRMVLQPTQPLSCHSLILQAHVPSPWHPWAERYLYTRPEANGMLGKKMTWRTMSCRGHSTDYAGTAWTPPHCHLCSALAPGHRPWIQTQSPAGTCQRGDSNGSETLCHFCSPIFLAREQFSRKWKVYKEFFMNMALPQHLACPTKTMMLGNQNRAGDTRDSTFVLTLLAVLKGWKNVEEEG